MKTKILFIDVDGTLVGFKDNKQYIPQSAIDSIRQARQNGCLVYLCTGRSMAEIGNIMEIGFDGVIGAAGGYVENKNEVILHQIIPENDLNEITHFLDENNIAYDLECNSGLYQNQQMETLMVSNGLNSGSFWEICHPLNEAPRQKVNKISFISPNISFEEIQSYFHDNYHLVKASWPIDKVDAGEISMPGITKATAIHSLLDHLHLEDVETYGFGDSMNDLEMFACVDYAIAMGNAKHGVLDQADYITKTVDDDGLAHAFKHFHLI